MVKKPKTKSQQARARIFIIWKKMGKPGDSEEYYNKIMDWFINRLDKKIADLEMEPYTKPPV